MTFIGNPNQLVLDRYDAVPRKIVEFVGDVAYKSILGSHLSDYISEPFFHLSRPNVWVKERLDEYSAKNPDSADLVGRHMWNEYQTLNRVTLEEFYRDVLDAGFEVGLSELSSYRQDLRGAPKDMTFSELMACGASMALHKR